jgi:hypothetical protein
MDHLLTIIKFWPIPFKHYIQYNAMMLDMAVIFCQMWSPVSRTVLDPTVLLGSLSKQIGISSTVPQLRHIYPEFLYQSLQYYLFYVPTRQLNLILCCCTITPGRWVSNLLTLVSK